MSSTIDEQSSAPTAIKDISTSKLGECGDSQTIIREDSTASSVSPRSDGSLLVLSPHTQCSTCSDNAAHAMASTLPSFALAGDALTPALLLLRDKLEQVDTYERDVLGCDGDRVGALSAGD